MTLDQRFALFHRFQDQTLERINAGAFDNFEKFMSSHVAPPQTLPHYPQTQPQHMNPHQQLNQSVFPHYPANPYHQPKPGTYAQASQSNMPSPGFHASTYISGLPLFIWGQLQVTLHVAGQKSPLFLTYCPITWVKSQTFVAFTGFYPTNGDVNSEICVGPGQKRRPTDSIPGATVSKKPRQATTFETKMEDMRPNPDYIDLAIEAAIMSTAKPTSPPEDNDQKVRTATLESDSTSPESAGSNISKPPTPDYIDLAIEADVIPTAKLTPPSPPEYDGQKLKTATLKSNSASPESVSSSTSKAASSNSTAEGDAPPDLGSRCGFYTHLSKADLNNISLNSSVELAESACESSHRKSGVLLNDHVIVYTMQTILAWRASLAIPSNWLVVINNEDPRKHPISRRITDIAKVVLEEDRDHWTLVHLSIRDWAMSYYDSFLGAGTKEDDNVNMTSNCTQLINSVRSLHPKSLTTLPAHDPSMTAKVSQTKQSLIVN